MLYCGSPLFSPPKDLLPQLLGIPLADSPPQWHCYLRLVLAKDSCFPQGHTSFLGWPLSDDRFKWEFKGPTLSIYLESSEGSPHFQNSLSVWVKYSIETMPRLDFSLCPILLLLLSQVIPRTFPKKLPPANLHLRVPFPGNPNCDRTDEHLLCTRQYSEGYSDDQISFLSLHFIWKKFTFYSGSQ